MSFEEIRVRPVNSKAELMEKLKLIAEHSKDDSEVAHSLADEALIEFIGDADIRMAFDNIIKWYA